MCKFCAGRASALSLTTTRLCKSCADRAFEQELFSFAFVPCVVCKACALTFLASCHNTRFPLYLKLSGNRLCNFCAGFAWPPFNPLQKLCQSCAAGSLEQGLCSPVLLSFVSDRNLVRVLCPSFAGNRFSLTLDRLCESCAARFLVQDLCSCACVPCVWYAKLVRQPCFPTQKTTTDKARFHFYLSFRAARLCKFCAGCAWAFSLSPHKLCESCADRFFEQELCSLAFVSCPRPVL